MRRSLARSGDRGPHKLTRRSGRTSSPLRSGLSFPMPSVDVQAAAWALTRKALSEAVARSDALHKSQERINLPLASLVEKIWAAQPQCLHEQEALGVREQALVHQLCQFGQGDLPHGDVFEFVCATAAIANAVVQ